MTDERTTGSESPGEFDRGFAGQRRRQARQGLALSPAERLRWLEQTMVELRTLQGRARLGRPVSSATTGRTETSRESAS